MTQIFGDRSTFSVEIGEVLSPGLRTVDLWAGGKWLTGNDNAGYVPSVFHYMRLEAADVRRRDAPPPCPYPGRPPRKIFRRLHRGLDDFRERFRFLRLTEITDNFFCYAYRDGDDLVMVFQIHRAHPPLPDQIGKVFSTRLPADDFAAILERAADFLDAEWVRPPDRN